jgi:Glycosyltransferase like family 2
LARAAVWSRRQEEAVSDYNDVTSGILCAVVAAGLAGALLIGTSSYAAAATSGAGGEPLQSPDDETPPSTDDQPILQPADDSDVVILGPEEQDQQVRTVDGPGGGQPGDADDRSGPLASFEMDLAAALGLGLLGLVSLALAAISATGLRRMLHAWWSSTSLIGTEVDLRQDPPTTSFSLMVVARRDEEAYSRTLERLAAFERPDVEIVAVVGDDQLGARALATAAAYRRPDRIRVVVDRRRSRSRPEALNTGLAACRGDVIGVFQPGDDVHPGLLRHVEATLAATGADVVQSAVLFTHATSSWPSIHRMLEGYFWFRSRLHYQAQQRFTPLANTSLFARVDVLRDAGGWDEDAVAEGAELGVRLSVAGVPVAVTWDPVLATRTAAPTSIGALTRQQTRWIQGFLHVLRKGVWRDLPTRRQRLLAEGNLAMPFLEAIAGAAIPILAVAAVASDAPPPIVLAACLPLVPVLMTVAVETAGLGDLRVTSQVRVRPRDRLLLVLGAIPYRILLATAALRALVRELRGSRRRDTVSHMEGGSASTDDPDRPRLAQRPTGRRRQVDDRMPQAGTMDR